MPDIPWGKLFRKRYITDMLKDKSLQFFSSLSRKAWMAIAAGTVVLAVLLFAFFRSAGDAEGDKQPQEAASVDTLALNIICTPTLDCLPFYHAVESGLCDSLGLQLAIRTERSQFDIDSIMRRTRVYDAAVIDDARLAHYRSVEGKAPKAGMQQGKPAKAGKKTKAAPKGSAKNAATKGADAHAVRQFYPMPALTEAIRLENTWRMVTSVTLRIREVAKMRKRTVAVARFSASSECLKQALASAGLKESDVYQAQINDIVLRQHMLDESQVDAAMLPEPYATLASVGFGHRIVWKADTVSRAALCFRTDVLKKPRKQQQLKLLKEAYRLAAADLNRRGTHAADSALMNRFDLPVEILDTLRLPKYRTGVK